MNERTPIIRALTREEQELLCFAGAAGYHMRLQQYWEYPQGFAERTTAPKSKTALSMTKTFRCCLRRFIRGFRPEPLLPNGALWLHLEKNGRFSVRLGIHGEELTDFSEGDFYIFQYLCFLQIRRFWNDLRKCGRFPAAMLPALIGDFSNRLEESEAYDTLLRQALEVASQVIVL